MAVPFLLALFQLLFEKNSFHISPIIPTALQFSCIHFVFTIILSAKTTDLVTARPKKLNNAIIG